MAQCGGGRAVLRQRQSWRSVSKRGRVQGRASGTEVVQPEAPGEVGFMAPERETDGFGRERVRRRREGWSFWSWRGYRCHYCRAGDAGPPVVLIHGFGAHSWHWRYNLLPLAHSCRVFAPDLLGFGLSPKGLETYSAELWAEQISHFVEHVAPGERAVLAGNSIGAVVALKVATDRPDLVKGLSLINPAGRFDTDRQSAYASISLKSTKYEPTLDELEFLPVEAQAATPMPLRVVRNDIEYIKEKLSRFAAIATFYSLRFRIRRILQSIYGDPSRVDDDLVQSLEEPANDENAMEVFYRVAKSGPKSGESAGEMLRRLRVPLQLLWGMVDPWIQVGKAETIQAIYPHAQFVAFDNGGHCPHDDSPEDFNEALGRFTDSLEG